MRLSITLLISYIIMSNAQAITVKLLHYNIKELDSTKIAKPTPQLEAVKQILSQYKFDVLSLNEVQYDTKNVPDKNYQTTGKNLDALKKFFALKELPYISFHQANTGNNARKKPDGTYYIKPNSSEAREHADQFNFGTLPGQYSTGALSRYKIKSQNIITDLKWKEFNPKVDFSNFATASGASFSDDMLLFDKNFSDVVLDIAGKEVHLILLHTVPAYHFGNSKSINALRNAEQLRFLEWYLTGKTDFTVKLNNINPLKKGAYFIAVGDLNVALSSTENPGAKVLKRLFKKTNPWIAPEKMTFTNEGSTFNPLPFRLMLDYMLSSKNITPKNGKIIHADFSLTDVRCATKEKKMTRQSADRVEVQWISSGAGESCRGMITRDYFNLKQASDHYPLYGEFEIK